MQIIDNAIPRLRITLFVLLACTTFSIGCSESSGSKSPEDNIVTLNANEGIVFSTGEILPGDKFNQVDLIATDNGDRLRLASGGATTTKANPVNWFPSDSGLYQMFESLEDVPEDKPGDTPGTSQLKTTAGYGFVLKNYISDGYTRGWIQSSSPTQVVIHFEVID